MTNANTTSKTIKGLSKVELERFDSCTECDWRNEVHNRNERHKHKKETDHEVETKHKKGLVDSKTVCERCENAPKQQGEDHCPMCVADLGGAAKNKVVEYEIKKLIQE